MEIISKYKLIFLVTLILLTAIAGCLVVKTVDNQGQENFIPEANNALTLPSTPNASSSNAIANSQKEINVTLIINTGSSSTYEFSASVATGTTVFSLLEKFSEEKGFSFLYQESDLGAFIEEIYGVKNDAANNMYWMYKVNGVLANVGASNYHLNEGDIVEWDYEEVTSF